MRVLQTQLRLLHGQQLPDEFVIEPSADSLLTTHAEAGRSALFAPVGVRNCANLRRYR